VSRLLVTGFEPFGGFRDNPSSLVLEHLPDRIEELSIEKMVLPVDTEGVKPVLARIHAAPYRAILHLGLASDRSVITLERRAVNLLDFTIADNRGVLLERRPIIEDGPDAYAARLPLEEILRAWESARISAAPSDSAGTFLCNQVMYTSLHALPPEVRTGFIHLPPAEIYDLARQARAVHLALELICSL
jgi:pyroglutamyl-peptidase